jgi:citrate lyase beta subunit
MTDAPTQPRRSLIFCPGNKPELYPKAVATGADIVCIDLEDAIAPQNKRDAREKTLPLFDRPVPEDGIERVVRINCLRTPEGLADVQALLERNPGPPSLMLTKVKHAEEVKLMDDWLSARGLATRLQVIIETNDGLHECYDIARASPRVDALLFGAVDMAAELRTKVSWETMLYVRSRLVHAAAGAGIDLLDVPYLDLNDQAGLESEARAAATLGFTGKAAIHPKQIPVINAAFSPDEAAVARAKRIIDAFVKDGSGLVVVDGTLIERPVLRSMYRLVAIAERAAARAAAPVH